MEKINAMDLRSHIQGAEDAVDFLLATARDASPEFLSVDSLNSHGEMDVHLLHSTPNPRRMLVFAKRTRHLAGVAAWEETMAMPEEEITRELEYVFSTIGSGLEFVHYTFLFTGVTRAFTHQLVRHRVGVAFAQQAQRLAKMENFGYLADDTCKALPLYHLIMYFVQKGYATLMETDGIKAQDARGVLPTNIRTNILLKINLRAMMDMLNIRLCLRAQGEYQRVALKMIRLAEEAHPWLIGRSGPACISRGACAFPRYADCPLKANRPWLNGPDPEELRKLKEDWAINTGQSNQPTGKDMKGAGDEWRD